ncbi:MAG: hypothetical protein J6332_02150 [Abditibacteriota bacterium]|nr:hypothetical protein [Abditibacteriota bacterium]
MKVTPFVGTMVDMFLGYGGGCYLNIAPNGTVSMCKAGSTYFMERPVCGASGFVCLPDKTVFGLCGTPYPVALDFFKDAEVAAEQSKVTVDYPRAKIVYDFREDDILVSLTAKDDEVWFCMKLRNDGFLRTPDGRYIPSGYPVQTFDSVTYFAGKAYNLTFENVKVGWGYIVMKAAAGETSTMTITAEPNTAEEKEYLRFRRLTPDKRSGTFNLYSPSEYRVFQRDTKDFGDVIVSGYCDKSYDKVAIDINGVKGESDVDKTTGGFSFTVRVPAGGWYKAEASALKSGEVVEKKIIDKVGVGEVFVGAGQSNSTNSGEFQTKQESGMVSCYDGKLWQLANDPVMGAQDESGGGSYYPAFGDALYAKYKVPVGIVSTGVGGSAIRQWMPDGDFSLMYLPERGRMFDLMMNKIYKLGKGGFRALLWHQGEADADGDPERNYASMVRIIRTSTEEAGWYFPWFVAKASYIDAQHPTYDSIRTVHQRLWDNGIALPGPDTDELRGDCRDTDGAGIHLSPKGLKAHGEMWAECVSRYLDEIL